MSQISLRYHGVKDVHEDALYGTGLWGRGAVKKVDRELAAHMLMHPDVWEDARPAAARKKDPIVPKARPQQYQHHLYDKEPALANLNAMTKDALANYAMREFNERIPAENMSEQQVREKVTSLLRSRAY
jgi:hypothetical protein